MSTSILMFKSKKGNFKKERRKFLYLVTEEKKIVHESLHLLEYLRTGQIYFNPNIYLHIFCLVKLLLCYHFCICYSFSYKFLISHV